MAETVNAQITDAVATVEFFHPKSNSLPGSLLAKLAQTVTEVSQDPRTRVILLRSQGEKAFCAGASFDELVAIDNPDNGKEFFMGFARLILAMKKAPQFVVVRIQGKAVGGGVGVASAADIAYATDAASIKLSELAVGIGPFVVGPAVEHRIGRGPFAAMSIDTDWRDAGWAHQHGLYAKVFADIPALDAGIDTLVKKLAKSNPEAMAELKKVFWEGTDHWDRLLEERAVHSGRLVLSDFTKNAIAQFANRGK